MVERLIASNAGDRGSIFGRDRPKSLKQVVTAPLNKIAQIYYDMLFLSYFLAMNNVPCCF